MKKKIFITLGYQNFTDYFIELIKHLKNNFNITCLVYGYKNYLKVKENKKLFHKVYSYEKLVNEFYKKQNNNYYKTLINFENKYGSLWKSLYSDRQLLDNFYDVDYGDEKLDYNDLLKFAYQWCNFFEKIFNNKEYKYIISYSTASFPALLSIKISGFYGVKYLCFKTLGIPDRFTIIDDINDELLVPLKNKIDYRWAKNYLSNLNKNKKPNWILKRKKISFFRRIYHIIKNILLEKKIFKFIDNNKSAYLNHTFFKIIKIKLKKIYRKINFLFTKLKNINEIKSKYIYFPLHVEPESNLMVKNIINTDQLHLIENISKLCPIDTKIVIKDHPNQSIRSSYFYSRINKIPNTLLIDSAISSGKLIKNAEAVICISGTSILETILMRKKLLVFGNNIIIKNFFPELKCNYSNFQKKMKNNALPSKKKIIKMIAHLKNISVDINSEILIKKKDPKKISLMLLSLFKRIDE